MRVLYVSGAERKTKVAGERLRKSEGRFLCHEGCSRSLHYVYSIDSHCVCVY